LARISHATKATIANTATAKPATVGGLDQQLPGPSVIAYRSEPSAATDSAAPTGSRRPALGDRDSGMLSRPAAMAAITTGTLTRNTEPPTSGPSPRPSAATPVQTAMARARAAGSAKTSVTIDNVAGRTSATVDRLGHGRAQMSDPKGETVLTYNQMVVRELADDTVDHLFHALADATRRDILRRSVRGELSVSRLADPMSFAAVQKHVAVLERAGLVTKARRGREQLVRTDPDAVGRARQALDQLETAWRGRVDRMSHLLALVPDPRDSNPRGQGT